MAATLRPPGRSVRLMLCAAPDISPTPALTTRSNPQVFAPLLHPSALQPELSAALLLHGPHGSGRRTAARAAAAALGLHCVAVSCHELAAPPGQDAAKGGAAAALRAVVAAAERFAPTMLLLQVGSGWGDGGRDGGDWVVGAWCYVEGLLL